MKLNYIIGLFLLTLLMGCSSAELADSNSAEGKFKIAQKYEKNERFEEAIIKYREVKNKFPYSRFATESELRIAEINFKRQSFDEAENNYKLFKEFHPKHPKSDYITFQIGMSIYKQLPESIDRDLSRARDAISYFEDVFTTYPSSDYSGSAKDHRVKCLQKLARKEDYIANFYFIREMYDSALSRYEGIISSYPNLGLDAKALYGAAYSAWKTEDREKANSYVQNLLKKHSKSKWAKEARSKLRAIIK